MINLEGLYDTDNGDILSICAKGWVDPTEFIQAVKDEFEFENVELGKVRHVLARKVPRWEWETNGPIEKRYYAGWTFTLETEPGRGVFKATYIDLW